MSSRLLALSNGILTKKGEMRVLILGPYRATFSRTLLNQLVSCLKNDGYTNTTLVVNHPFPRRRRNETTAEYNLRKSETLIVSWAQVTLYIFPSLNHPNVDYSGVILEYSHMLNKAVWLLGTSTVFFERKGFKKASTLLKGKIIASGISQRYFTSSTDLCKAALSELMSHLRVLY